MQDNQTQQPEIITKTIAKAVELLKASGAQFKVISPNGDEFGELEVVAAKQKTFRFGHGELSRIYKPLLETLKVGEVATVKNPDASKYDLEDIRGSAAAWIGKHWGSEAHTSTIDRAFNTVEILRIK
jgi:hypothetical protein